MRSNSKNWIVVFHFDSPLICKDGLLKVVASIGNPDGAESIECQLDPFPSMDRNVLQEIWLEGFTNVSRSGRNAQSPTGADAVDCGLN